MALRVYFIITVFEYVILPTVTARMDQDQKVRCGHEVVMPSQTLVDIRSEMAERKETALAQVVPFCFFFC